MADQITALNSHIDAQEQLIKKYEERERSLQNTMVTYQKIRHSLPGCSDCCPQSP